MKVRFEIDTEIEGDLYKTYLKATDFYSALGDIDNVCRSYHKYCEEPNRENAEKVIDEVRSLVAQSGYHEIS